MSRVNISQTVDPNTMLFEIHEQYKTRISVLISRAEAITLCDKLRDFLGDAPTVPIAGPKLAMFPATGEMPIAVKISS